MSSETDTTDTDTTDTDTTDTTDTDHDFGISADQLADETPPAYPPSQPIHEGGHGHKEPSDGQYYRYAIILAVLTALEILSTEAGPDGPWLVPILIVLMLVKFWVVAASSSPPVRQPPLQLPLLPGAGVRRCAVFRRPGDVPLLDRLNPKEHP